jgi:hypothetical protein
MPHPSEAACDGNEHLRLLLDERTLLFGRERQVRVALLLRSQTRDLLPPTRKVGKPECKQ